MAFFFVAAIALAAHVLPAKPASADQAAACLECHPSRNAGVAGVPVLAGQHPAYIVRQLDRFAAATTDDQYRRANARMAHAAARLPRSEWMAVAEALSAQDCVYTGDLNHAALAENPCASCHGARGLSGDPEIPNLAGQNLRYLYYQYQKLREPYVLPVGDNAPKQPGRLHPVMGPVAAGLRDNVIGAMTYYSKLPCR